MTGHEQFEELAAGYAIGALDELDRQAFERHLAECPACRGVLTELGPVAAGLGLAAEPLAPPAALRAKVLAAATARPQVASPRPLEAQRTWAWLSTAAAVVLIAGLGLYGWGLRRELASTREMLAAATSRASTLREELAAARLDSIRLTNTLNVLGSTDVLRVDLRGTGAAAAASGLAFVSVSRGLVFTAAGLPPLPTNQVYQLWVVPAGAGASPVSAGLLQVEPTGGASLAVPLGARLDRVGAVAVSVEPAGGSAGPTTTPLLVGTVSSN